MNRSTHTLAVKSQNWFVQALLHLATQKPYADITVSELCRQAGLDRRTFYRNFTDKNDVMAFYFSTLQAEYVQVLRHSKERTFHALARMQFAFWEGHPAFIKAMQADPSLLAMMLQNINTFIPEVYTPKGETLSKEMQYSVSFVTGGLYNVLAYWLTTGLQETPGELADMISSLASDDIFFWPVLED